MKTAIVIAAFAIVAVAAYAAGVSGNRLLEAQRIADRMAFTGIRLLEISADMATLNGETLDGEKFSCAMRTRRVAR